MKPVSVSRLIDAPIGLVFQTISDPRNFREAVPHIKNVEFLSDRHTGVGTRFRETRVMKGREESVELEITEFEENDRVRIVSDAGGSIWDTVFTVAEAPGGVNMHMQMDVRPHTFAARIMNRFVRGLVVKGVVSDMDAIKAYCESAGHSEG
ncbi:MAG: hypothetical protein HKN17_10990 [Rhodothermales bacterium]|nr:hypothetical protein [Rhodothermales bacterium]